MDSLADATDADVIIGTESWLDSSINSNEVFPPGYIAYRRDRPSDSHGGVFILVSSKFESCQPEKLQLQSESEMVWVKISVRGVKDLYVCSFYKKPALRQPGCFSYLETCLQMIPPDSHIWVGGDFNLPDIDWETDTVRPYGQQTTISNELLSTVQNAHLVQMVEEPTRVTDDTSTTPDLFFTSNKSLINTVKIIPGISNHDIVYIESSLRPIINKTVPRKTYQYKKADFESIRKRLLDYRKEFED